MTQSERLIITRQSGFAVGALTAKPRFLLAILLGCIAFSPSARAVNPPPDGGYANFNTAEGTNALFSLTTGVGNTALGRNALHNDTSGQSNTAIGYDALYFNTGSFNTADGRGALYENTIGNYNTATGYQSLNSNATGYSNTADGYVALAANNGGYENTAVGAAALVSNTSGASNTAVGYAALDSNTIGGANTAVGLEALDSNIGGSADTGIGYQALFSNTSGYDNAATGYQTLYFNTDGYQNTADGDAALSLITTGNNNIAIGYSAGGSLTTGSNNIDIGNLGVGAEANTIRIGTEGTQTNIYVAGVSGVTVAGGIGVIVDSSGHLGTSTSSARYKENIQPMDKASEAILSLQPVTFRYKHELDPKGIPQFGLVAEQVEKIDPDLVARDQDGKPYSVRYEAINAMVLNEFLKAHRRIIAQESEIQELRGAVTEMKAMLESQRSEMHKVNARVAKVESAPRLVLNAQ